MAVAKTLWLAAMVQVLVCTTVLAAEKTIPILGWHGIQPDQVSAARYAEARDMGMTILMQWAPNVETARKYLDLAQGQGLKLMIHMGDLYEEGKCEAVARALKDHPALAMYHIVDEPLIPAFDKIGRIVRKMNAADPVHEPYVNLINCVGRNPSQWYGGTDSYPEYVKTFLDKVPVKSVSFDKYPVIAREFFPKDAPLRTCEAGYCVKTNWYETLEPCYREAKARKIPMYAFAQSCAYRCQDRWDFAEPQVAHMLLQQNVNLAYGAQLLQYYVYWQTSSHESMPFSVQKPYLRTSVFDRVREVNRRIQARAFVFAGCNVKSVRHTGKEIPTATTRLTATDLPPFVTSLETPDGGAVVSRLANAGTEYIAIVNRSPERELTLKIGFTAGVKRIRDDGTVVDAALYSDEYWLEPGSMEIFAAPVQ